MEFLIILFLLILNGIFAMYEIALVSSSKARLETLVAKGNKSARGVLKQSSNMEHIGDFNPGGKADLDQLLLDRKTYNPMIADDIDRKSVV